MTDWELKESPITNSILDFFEKKYCKDVAIPGLLKCCSIASAKLVSIGLPKLNIFNVAPSRQFKSQTTIEACKMFPSSYSMQVGSDFTIFYLAKIYKDGKFNKRCLVVNDGTVLFTTKAERTKDRLIGGLSEITSDGKYTYGERLKDESIKGQISVIMNMTDESYNKHEKKLLGSTFLERFLTVFHRVTTEDLKKFNLEKDKRKLIEHTKFKFDPRIKVVVSGDVVKRLNDYADNYSIQSMRTLNGTFDQLLVLVISLAALNGRDYISEDEFKILDMLKPFITVPGNAPKIIELAKRGYDIRKICEFLGKDFEKYRPYVHRIVKKVRERGVLAV